MEIEDSTEDPAYPIDCREDDNEFLGELVECKTENAIPNPDVCWKKQDVGKYM